MHKNGDQILHVETFNVLPFADHEEEGAAVFSVSTADWQPLSAADVVKETTIDLVFQKVFQHIIRGWPDVCMDNAYEIS
jgi:hypothetical protein